MNEKMTAAEKATLGGIGFAGVLLVVLGCAFSFMAVTMIMDVFL